MAIRFPSKSNRRLTARSTPTATRRVNSSSVSLVERFKRMTKDEVTRFLTVDLVIVAREPLNSIVESFGEKVFVLYVGRRGRFYYAYLELANSYRDSAEKMIQKFVALVKKLPREDRKTWDQAKSREFDIGIQEGGLRGELGQAIPLYFLQLKQKTLEDVMNVNGTLAFTVYPPEPEMPTKRKKQ